MSQKNKTVTLGEHSFLIRKLPPEMGSFIFIRLLGVQMRTQSMAPTISKTTELSKEPEVKPSGEDMVRSLTFLALSSGGVSFEEFKFIQRSCMDCVGINVEREAQTFPMPLLLADGRWTPEGQVVTDKGLLMKLMMEVLVFCFADFFGESGHGL